MENLKHYLTYRRQFAELFLFDAARLASKMYLGLEISENLLDYMAAANFPTCKAINSKFQ